MRIAIKGVVEPIFEVSLKDQGGRFIELLINNHRVLTISPDSDKPELQIAQEAKEVISRIRNYSGLTVLDSRGD